MNLTIKEQKQKIYEFAVTHPWRCYARNSYHVDYNIYKELEHIGAGYYFVCPKVFEDYFEDLRDPQQHEKEYLKLFMEDIVWCYWFDYDKFKVEAKKNKRLRTFASDKHEMKRNSIMSWYGWR